MKHFDADYNELFARLSCGDTDAFDCLFNHLYAPLVLFSMSFVRDKTAAEDIVSEAFCNLWSDRSKYKGIHYGKTYLFTTVRNRSYDLLRRQSKIKNEQIDENISIEMDFDLDTIFEIDLYTRLGELIAILPEKCSNILKLKLEGSSDKEISEKLGISFETVRSHEKRGFKLIRNKTKNCYSIMLFM